MVETDQEYQAGVASGTTGNAARSVSAEVCRDLESPVQKGEFVQQAMDACAGFCAVEEAKWMLGGMLESSR